MRKKPLNYSRKKILAALLLLLLFFEGSTNVSAIELVTILIITAVVLVVTPLAIYAWKFFFGPVLKFIINIVLLSIAKLFMFFFEPFVRSMLETLEFMMNTSPTIYPFDKSSFTIVGNLMKLSLKILAPFYILLLSLTGAYIIYAAAMPQERARAKALFNKTLLSMFLVSCSPILYQLMLDVTQNIVSQIMESIQRSMSEYAMNAVITAFSNLIVIQIMVLLIPIVLIVLVIRLVMIYVCAIFFPVALFLFFFDFTKDLGSNLLRYTVMWIGMPIVQSIIYSITILTVAEVGANLQNYMLSGFILISGLTGLVIVTLLTSGLMKWVGGALSAAGISLMGKAGGLGRMFGAGAMIAAGSVMMHPTDAGAAIQGAGVNAGMMSQMREGGGLGHVSIGRRMASAVRRSFSGGGGGAGGGGGGGGSRSRGGIFRGVAGAASAIASEWRSDGGFRPSRPGSGASAAQQAARRATAAPGTVGTPTDERASLYKEGSPTDKFDEGVPYKDLVEPGSIEVEPDKTKFPDIRNLYGSGFSDRSRWLSGQDLPSIYEKERLERLGHVDAAAGFFTKAGAMWRGRSLLGDEGSFMRLKAAGVFLQGVGRLGLSVAPISPFAYTFRLFGAYLSSFAAESVPEGEMRSIFMDAGHFVAGLGIRQATSRAWNENSVARNANRYTREANEAARLRKDASDMSLSLTTAERTALTREAEIHERKANEAMDLVKDRLKRIQKGGDLIGRGDTESYERMSSYLFKHHRGLRDRLLLEQEGKFEKTEGGKTAWTIQDKLKEALDEVNKRRAASSLPAYTMDDFHTEGSAARSEVIDELLSNKKFKDVRDEIGKQYGIGVFKLVSTKTHADDKKLVVEGAGPISPFPDPRSWSPDDSQFGLVREEAKAFLLRNITKKGFRGARRLTAEERSFYNQHAVEVDAHGKPQRLLFGERTLDGDVFLSDAEYKALRLRMHQAGGGVRYHKKLNDEQVSLVRDASGAAVRNASGKYMLKLFPFGHQTPYGDYMEFDNLSEALAMEAKMRTDRWVFGAGVAAENITEQWGRMDATQKAAYGNNIDTYAAARVDALKRLRQNGGAMHQQEILILRQKHNMTGEQINELSARQIGESREMLAGAALHDVTDPTLRSHIGREFARGDRSAAAIYTGMTAAQKAAFATSYGIANTQNEIEKKLSELQKNFTKLHSRAGINGVRFEFQEGTVNPTWVDPHSRLLVVNLGSNVFKAAPANNFTSQAPGTQDAFGRGVTGNAAFVYATATAEEQAQVEAEWYMRGRGAADLASLSAGARNYFIRQLEVSSSTSGLDYRDPEHRRFIETAWHSRTQVDFDSPNAQAAMTYALLHEMGHNLVQRDIEAGIGSGRKGWKKLTRKYTTGETGAAATEMAATEIAKQLAADAGLSAKFDAGRKIVLGRAAEQSLQRAGRRKEAYDEALKRRGGVRNIRDEHITAVLGSTDKALEETLGFVAGARGELELEASIAPDIHKEVALRMRMEVEAGNTNYGMGTGSAASNIWGSLSDSEKNALKGRVAAARGIDLSVVSDSDVLTSLSSAYSSINPITGSLNSQVDTLESDSGVLRRTGKKMSQREADNLEQMRGSLPALVQSQVDDVLDAKGAASRAYRKRRAKWQSQTAVEVAADAVEIHNEVVT